MNPTPTTDTQRLRELLAAATPGPWRMVLTRFHGHEVRSEKYDLACGVAEEDAELIAALRNEAPALLEEIDRLRKDSAELNAVAKVMGNRPVFDGFKTSPEKLAALMHVAESRDPKGEFMKAIAERDKLREEVERLQNLKEVFKQSYEGEKEYIAGLEQDLDTGKTGEPLHELIDSLRRENEELKSKLR